MMTRNITILLLLAAVLLPAADLFAQDEPQPSPAGSVSTTVGLTNVTIEYFRPKMKGRKIFGDGDDFLVPYGKMWRTGANSGSIISFSDDVTVEGQDIPAGKYTIFTIPSDGDWVVTFYKDTKIGGYVSRYKDDEELTRFTVSTGKKAETVQTLTFAITDISDDSTSAYVEFSWENTSFKLKVTDK